MSMSGAEVARTEESMSHSFVIDCECRRCQKERDRRQRQSLANRPPPRRQRARRERVASREEQHTRYIDCGPQAWDDRD